VFAANHTDANIGYKTLMKTSDIKHHTDANIGHVNARTTFEAIKLCHFFSLWCSDGLSLIRYQLVGPYDRNHPTIKPVKYLNLKSYTGWN
jgi:hypothetical protein